jgi:hypothetical protein
MRLIGIPGKVINGEILLEDRNLLKLSEDEIVDVRGNLSFVPPNFLSSHPRSW